MSGLIERLRAEAPHCAIRSAAMPPKQVARGLKRRDVDLMLDEQRLGHRFAVERAQPRGPRSVDGPNGVPKTSIIR
jgi:hypothetical protein